MGKNKNRGWLGLVAAGVLAFGLAACGGDDGATGPQGPAGPEGPAGPAGPTGPAGTGQVDMAFITPEAWESASLKAEVKSVIINSAPVVEFTLTDEQGNPVVGMEKITSKSSTATVPSYPNVSFALAKLMPRTDQKQSEWVSYIVTSPAYKSTTTTPPTDCPKYPSRPTTDNTGTLEAVAGKPGSYKYTFWRDVKQIQAEVLALPDRPTATNDPCYSSQYPTAGKNYLGGDAQLTELAWAPALPHRLTIQISGAAPGTGSNTPNGATVSAAANLANPVNVVYDFLPNTEPDKAGTIISPEQLTREDVNVASCNVCHGKLAFHGGSARVETRYCVVCHTEQRGYGYANVASTAGKFPALAETVAPQGCYGTGICSYTYDNDPTKSGSQGTNVADGEFAGNFVTMIHKIHQGNWLVKENYYFAGVAFNNKGFSKLGGGQRMCTTCHDSKLASTADNYRNLPSRQACGACHDGIVWSTGGGSTLGDKQKVVYSTDTLATSGHVGRAQADDSKCAQCHTPDYIKYDHRMENITTNNPAILPGLASFRYEIISASQDATSKDVTIKFRIWQKTSPSDVETAVTFLPPAVQPSTAVVLTGFTGSPSFLLAYAVTQDGVTTPVDYNNLPIKQSQPISVAISALLNTSTSATGANINTVGSLSARDTNDGSYTATIRGNGSAVCGGSTTPVKCVFPDNAKMRAVALQGYFTQVGAPTDNQGGTGNVGRHAISVVKKVNTDTERRKVVDPAKCAGCHEWFEGHGGNRVYETQVCVMCHVPGLATSGRGVADAPGGNYPGIANYKFTIADEKILADWKFDKNLPNAALKFPVTTNNFKDMIHGIHSGRERWTPFADARDRTSTAATSTDGGVIQLLDFRRMDFPGRLNNCETCHVTATSNTATYNTVPAGALVSTYESVDAAYAAGIAGGTATTAMAKTALNTANTTDIVATPFAAACASCHDNTPAKAHITLMGGAFNLTRAAAQPIPRPLEDVESCAVCHGPGRDFDTRLVHSR